MRAILKQAGHQEENLPSPSKKVKASHEETMNKLVEHYTSRGHYVPYGSVNSSNTSYSKNIQSNQYSLCFRRFSGYKRSSLPLKTFNPLALLPKCEATQAPAIPSQAIDKGKFGLTPTLASLLDEDPIPRGDGDPQRAPVLADLLEDGNSADKKARKPRKRRGTSDGPPTPSPSGRKRKKSDNEDLSIKLQTDPDQGYMPAPSPHSSLNTPATPTFNQRPSFPKPDSKNSMSDSHLAKLLGMSSEADRKPPGLVRQNSAASEPDVREPSPKQVKTESSDSVSSMTQLTVKIPKLKDIKKETKTVRQISNAEATNKEKRIKKQDSLQLDTLKMGLSKSMDNPSSPSGKKGVSRIMIKNKGGKIEIIPKTVPATAPALPLKSGERSPKSKKPGEREKKKKTSKSPVSSEQKKSQSSPFDPLKGGFYGASNLKSLPKIPKKQPGESKSPTKEQGAVQSSPVLDWTSPPTTRVPSLVDPPNLTSSPVQRNKPGVMVTQPVDAKRPALLPTPSTPPLYSQTKPPSLFQRKGTLNDVIHKLNSSGKPATPTQTMSTVTVQPNTSVTWSGKHQSDVTPNSPEEKVVPTAQPVTIPIASEDPESPTMTIADSYNNSQPKAIPLNPGTSSDAGKPKSILAKQKPVSRPLTFSPKPTGLSDRLDDDLMDVALGCK